jgi:hypothetical protein
MSFRRRFRFAGAAIGVAALVLTVGAGAGPAFADTTATPLVGPNASDPSASYCYDIPTGSSGTCLYDSQDLGQNGTNANPYPMNTTNMWFLPFGSDPSVRSNWLPAGGTSSSPAVLSESQYPWVTPGANHLWAPDMFYNELGQYALLVPDVADTGNEDTSSRIGVSMSSSAFGPFTYQGMLDLDPNNDQPNGGYASDPSATWANESANPWLVYANGTFNNCGGLSVAEVDFGFTGVVSGPYPLTINNLPASFNGCANNTRPYLEGPEIYQFSQGYSGYYLMFAAKPQNQNEVIAYAWSNSITGPYTYMGTIMNGSSTEFTNQASIVPAGNNFQNYLFFYHDGPSGTHNRKVHAECLHFNSDGTIQPITRSTSSSSLANCWNA